MSKKMNSYLMALVSSCVLLAGCAKEPEATATGSGSNTATTGGGAESPKDATKMAAVDFVKDVKPTLEKYCMPCHAGDKPAANINVSSIASNEDAKANSSTFGKMADAVGSGKMPPAKGKPLSDDERKKLVDQLKSLSS